MVASFAWPAHTHLEKYPACIGKFQGEPLRCRKCKTVARRYSLDLWWKGERHRIFTRRDNYSLDSWDRAYRLLTTIREIIDRGQFDPRDFVRKEIKHLVFGNYGLTWLGRRQQEGKNLRDIQAGDLIDFRDWLHQSLSSRTVSNLFGMLHKFFRDAHLLRNILHLPAFPQFKKKDPVTHWIDEDDQARVLAYIEDPVYRAFHLFLMRQGCRPHEARALRWENLDFKHDIVTINAAFDLNTFRPTTKEEDTRYLPLHPEVREALLQLPRHLNGFDFINRHGRPLSASKVSVHWRQAAEKAGIKVICYKGTRTPWHPKRSSRE